jgi:hypothetical protein
MTWLTRCDPADTLQGLHNPRFGVKLWSRHLLISTRTTAHARHVEAQRRIPKGTQVVIHDIVDVFVVAIGVRISWCLDLACIQCICHFVCLRPCETYIQMCIVGGRGKRGAGWAEGGSEGGGREREREREKERERESALWRCTIESVCAFLPLSAFPETCASMMYVLL